MSGNKLSIINNAIMLARLNGKAIVKIANGSPITINKKSDDRFVVAHGPRLVSCTASGAWDLISDYRDRLESVS